VTAVPRNGLRWQVSSELKAKGSATGSDCGSVPSFVLHFVLCWTSQLRTLVVLNNCLCCAACSGSWAMLPWFFRDAFVCSLVISHVHVFQAFSLLCPAVCLSVLGVLCFDPFYICWPTSLPNVYLFVASPLLLRVTIKWMFRICCRLTVFYSKISSFGGSEFALTFIFEYMLS